MNAPFHVSSRDPARPGEMRNGPRSDASIRLRSGVRSAGGMAPHTVFVRFVCWFAISVCPIACAGPDGADRVVIGQDRPAGSDVSGARKRAFLRLDEIEPAPVMPEAPTTAPHEPAAPARRYLSKARDRFSEKLWADAITALENAIRIDPRLTDARVLLARAAVRQGNRGLAESHMQEAVAQRPNDVAVQQLLGEIAWQGNRATDATRHFRLALMSRNAAEDRPETVLTHLSLAMALRKQGYLTAAADQLEVYLAAVEKPTPEMLEHDELGDVMVLFRGTAAGLLAEIYSQLGRHPDAVNAYRRAIRESPKERGLRRRLAVALARSGRDAEAFDAVQRLLADDTAQSDDLQLLRDICTETGQEDRYAAEIVRLAGAADNPAVLVRLTDVLLELGKKDAAVKALSRAVSLNPTFAEARYRLAGLYLEQSQYDRFVEALVEAARARPEAWDEADSLLGTARNDERAWAGVLASAGRLAEGRPTDAFVRLLHGRVLARDSRNDAAADEFREAVRLGPDLGVAAIALTNVLLERKDWEAATRTADAAIERDLRSAVLYHAKGRAHAALDQYDEALGAYRDALRLDRDSVEVLLSMADLSRRRGRYRELEQTYERIIEKVDRRCIPAREALIRLYLRHNRPKPAQELFREFERLDMEGAAVRRCRALLQVNTNLDLPWDRRIEKYRDRLEGILDDYPDDHATRLDLARTYHDTRDYQSCLDVLEQIEERAPDDLRPLELEAEVLGKLLEFEKAEGVVEAMLAERPRSAALQRKMVGLALNRADFGAAATRWRRLIDREDLGQQRQLYTAQLISVLLADDRIDEAVEASGQLIEDAPKDALSRAIHLNTLGKAGRHDRVIEIARAWLEEDPTGQALRADLISRLRDAGRFVEAQQAVLAWLADDPDDLELGEWLIWMAWANRDWDAALDIARVGLEQPDQHEEYMRRIGATLEGAGRYDEAVDHWQGLINAAPDLTEDNFLKVEHYHRRLLRVLMIAERYEQTERAIKDLPRPFLVRRAVLMGPNTPLAVQVPGLLITIYQRTHRLEKAMALLEEDYRAAPNSPGACNNLGYTWIDAGRELDKAEKLIRFAVGEEPMNSAYLDSLGWVYYKRGDFGEAIKYLGRALRQAGLEDPEILDHMGDALHRSGDLDGAKTRWEKSRDALIAAVDEFPPPNIEERTLRKAVEAKLDQLLRGEDVGVAALANAGPTTTRDSGPGNGD